jgi:tellurite resistance protein TerA
MEIKDKVVIREKGETAAIPTKNLVATLRWRKAVDLDLWCFYKTKDGKDGTISFGNKGKLSRAPFIELDKDSGVGDKGGDNEENIRFADLANIEHAYICANIYGKTNASFASYDGSVVVKADNKAFEVPLIDQSQGNWCVVAHLDNSSPVTSKLENVNVTIRDRPTIAKLVTGNLQSAPPPTTNTEARRSGGILSRLFGG